VTGLELWRWQESRTINIPIDALVPPQSQIEVKQQLYQANISFVVKVQEALKTRIPTSTLVLTIRKQIFV
jgi:hypothetical protein